MMAATRQYITKLNISSRESVTFLCLSTMLAIAFANIASLRQLRLCGGEVGLFATRNVVDNRYFLETSESGVGEYLYVGGPRTRPLFGGGTRAGDSEIKVILLDYFWIGIQISIMSMCLFLLYYTNFIKPDNPYIEKPDDESNRVIPQNTQILPTMSDINNQKALYIGVYSLKRVVLSMVQSLLLNLYNIQTKRRCKLQPFKSDKELPFSMAANEDTVRSALRDSLDKIFDSTNESEVNVLVACFEQILTTHFPTLLLKAAFDACTVCLQIIRKWEVENSIIVGTIPKENNQDYIHHSFDNRGTMLILSWDHSLFSADFIDTITMLAQKLRDEKRQPTPTEFLAYHVAYYQLSSGKTVTLKPFRSLGSPGFRPHTQTYMSLTDPGDGHVLGTTRFNDWLNGAIVHVEHLERPRNLPRKNIESYRIPSLLSFSKVRLHVGSAAPTTYFVGRRMKDSGNFDEDFLKVVHLTSASASAVFFQGGAECKVAMEGLTTSQAVRYMLALREHVHRNKHCQIMSAAWNLNQEVVDDYGQKTPSILTERIDIAQRAIEITAIGGFNKVTWDGAGDKYPSKCIMYQLDFEQALKIVHEAHEWGLLTYFSAGFKFGEIKHAVWAGVDGVGIGGAQILRFMDNETGMHGPYTEENIPLIMQQRDEAAYSFRGRGVKLLARLDTMFAEGSISDEENETRKMLFLSLRDQNEMEIYASLERMQRVINICQEKSSPLMGTCTRIAGAEKPVLKNFSSNDTEWCSFKCQLKKIIEKEDKLQLEEEYDGEPWVTYRKKYWKSICKQRGVYIENADSCSFPCKIVS